MTTKYYHVLDALERVCSQNPSANVYEVLQDVIKDLPGQNGILKGSTKLPNSELERALKLYMKKREMIC